MRTRWNGDELLATIHARLPEVRKIMLTGQASPEAIGRAVNNAGLFRFLPKPWSAEDLELTVRSALESLRGDRARQEQEAMLRELSDVTLALTATLAGSDRYAKLVESARRVLRAQRLVVFRHDDGQLRPLASSHPGPRRRALLDVLQWVGDLSRGNAARQSGDAARALSHALLGTARGDDSARGRGSSRSSLYFLECPRFAGHSKK